MPREKCGALDLALALTRLRRRPYILAHTVSLASLPGASATEATSRLLLPASRIGGVIGACIRMGPRYSRRGNSCTHAFFFHSLSHAPPFTYAHGSCTGRGGDVIKGIRELTGARINISASPGSGNASAQEEERDAHFRLVSDGVVSTERVPSTELGGTHARMRARTHARTAGRPRLTRAACTNPGVAGEHLGGRVLRVLGRGADRAAGRPLRRRGRGRGRRAARGPAGQQRRGGRRAARGRAHGAADGHRLHHGTWRGVGAALDLRPPACTYCHGLTRSLLSLSLSRCDPRRHIRRGS